MKKILLPVIVFMVTTLLPVSIRAQSASVDDLKIAYIYNFIRYTSWPMTESTKTDFGLCVHKASALQEKLGSLEGKRVKGGLIKVISVGNVRQELALCDVLVLPRLEEEKLKGMIVYATTTNTLTIADTQGYAHLGVMINMVVKDKKIAFEVNLDEVRRSDLKISSNLLKLAKIVQSGGR